MTPRFRELLADLQEMRDGWAQQDTADNSYFWMQQRGAVDAYDTAIRTVRNAMPSILDEARDVTVGDFDDPADPTLPWVTRVTAEPCGCDGPSTESDYPHVAGCDWIRRVVA